MSDDQGAVEAVPAEGTGPAEGGQAEPEAAPSPEYLDTDSYAGHHVRLKMDGQEVEVPLSEALSGYQRQADYTRKTQELAEQQRAAQFGLTLQQALENNPAETLRILQTQYTQPEPEPEQTWDDPAEARYHELGQRMERFEAAQAQWELRQAIGVLQERYGEEFNPRDVVARASAQGRMDLESVYKEMAFDRYWAGQQAAREQQAADEQGRIEAKTQAGNVHSGSGANNAVTPDTGSFQSVEDAWYAAKRTLGMT